MTTLADCAHRPAPRSLWREGIARRGAPLTVHEYLIDEANVRGFWGAFRRETPDRVPDPQLSLEDVIVGLLAAQAPAEARIFKLVLRLLQSGLWVERVLLLRAKREGALQALYWLLRLVPGEELTPPVRALREALADPPRGYRPLDYRYDSSRLIRRRATAEGLWRRLRR